jgi:hypothetical protein
LSTQLLNDALGKLMATNDDNDFAMVLWKLRDEEELHDRDENTRAESEQRRVDGELRERYARRSQMVPQVQALCYRRCMNTYRSYYGKRAIG